MGSAVKEVFERLGTSGKYWSARMKKRLGSRDLRGCYFASNRVRIRELSGQRGKRTANLSLQGVG